MYTYHAVGRNVRSFHGKRDAVERDAEKDQIVEPLVCHHAVTELANSTSTAHAVSEQPPPIGLLDHAHITSCKNAQDKGTFLRYQGDFASSPQKANNVKCPAIFPAFRLREGVQNVQESFCIGWLKRHHAVLPPPLTGVLHYCKTRIHQEMR